jgi:hypothetical protein
MSTTPTPFKPAGTQLPRPMAPSTIASQNVQNVSLYKAVRGLINLQQAGGLGSFGTVATTLPDGSPATFAQGQIDAGIIRIKPNGSPLALPNEWQAGGSQTQIAHGLGRIPIGYICIRSSRDVNLSDGTTPWDSTYIYLNTTHSDADTTVMFF